MRVRSRAAGIVRRAGALRYPCTLLTGYPSPAMLAALMRCALVVALLAVAGCRPERAIRPLFKLLTPARTGVTFANTITTNDSVNVQTEPYIYNGAGVAIGDIDNDGLPDIFFSGNMVSSRLYRNTGGMRFEDITKSAGVATNRWATGATMVDINNDGYLDIYVSVSGSERSKGQDRANLLFINNGDRTFTEAAARYGIADTGFTTHAVFLDYNRDGCLDLFLLNNSPKDFARGMADTHPLGVQSSSPEGYNKLYRNNCDGTFTDVSRQAGILEQVGYGLGVVVADVNDDGWPDIYVSNDVAPNDVLYINNRDGTFTDKAGAWLKHTSFAGMGVDIADFNNDGWPDILQMDMLPATLERQKRMSGYLTYGGRLDLRRRGFRDAYDVNSLRTGTWCSATWLVSRAWRAPIGAGAPCSAISTTMAIRTSSSATGTPKPPTISTTRPRCSVHAEPETTSVPCDS